MAPLRNAHPTIAEILDGKHDDLLNSFDHATKHRRKMMAASSGIRPKVAVTILDDPRAGKYAGRKGVVKSIGPKLVTVRLVCPTCGGYEDNLTPPRCVDCSGFADGVRISQGLLEVTA